MLVSLCCRRGLLAYAYTGVSVLVMCLSGGKVALIYYGSVALTFTVRQYVTHCTRCYKRFRYRCMLNLTKMNENQSNIMEVDQTENEPTTIGTTTSPFDENTQHNNNFAKTTDHEVPARTKDETNTKPNDSEATFPVLKSEPQSMIRKTTVLFKPYLDVGSQSEESPAMCTAVEGRRATGIAATSSLGAPSISTFNPYDVSVSGTTIKDQVLRNAHQV